MNNVFWYVCWVAISLSNVVSTTVGQKGNDGNAPMLGTVLYGRSDLARQWSDGEQIELQCRQTIGSLVPTKVLDNAEHFLAYFESIKRHLDRIGSEHSRNRATVLVADALGGYLYAEMLPRVRMSYYEGKSKYAVTKRLHDIVKSIKYVLDTDGRGWARPRRLKPKLEQKPERDPVLEPVPELCDEAVDAGPFGLLDDGQVPFFDRDGRPRSVVVPWPQRHVALFGVRAAGCRSVLAHHCALTAARLLSDRDDALLTNARQLATWTRTSVWPLMATNDWYPALQGMVAATHRLERAVAAASGPRSGDVPGHDDQLTVFNANFYVAVILASLSVFWTLVLCTFDGFLVQYLCSAFGHALCITQLTDSM